MKLNKAISWLSIALLSSTVLSCSVLQSNSKIAEDTPVKAIINLAEVQNDKILIELYPGNISGEEFIFHLPKIVPGTYSINNYGQFVEDFKAYDINGRPIEIKQLDSNTWLLPNNPIVRSIKYWVNDSYDVEGEMGVFSPAGTNILDNQNFMLNMHGIIGYIKDEKERPYHVEILRPKHLTSGTSLDLQATSLASENTAKDIFHVQRYFDLVDNPIMYSSGKPSSFTMGDIEVILSLYSPNNIYEVNDFEPDMKKMISAQKSFLGEIDNTSRYAILLYLADNSKLDAKGSGALEHHTSTVVVFPETMEKKKLQKAMVDVVSHEFFHILTPLNVHSKEIHNFDYIDPKMSRHLWLYEGVTEYFAHLFQVNQGLINEKDFYKRLEDKLLTSSNYDETLPFTEMSSKILEEGYKDYFYNVYHKGALIAMALDIRLRELSNGETGLLDVMKLLSKKYGKDHPFEDEELFQEITELTFPEVSEFFSLYVDGQNPLPYKQIFDKVGLVMSEDEITTSYFHRDRIPYLDLNSETGEIYFRKNIRFNSFLSSMGIQGGDTLKFVNGVPANPETIGNILKESTAWPIDQHTTLVIDRNGSELILEGRTFVPTETTYSLTERKLSKNDPAIELRNVWLKG